MGDDNDDFVTTMVNGFLKAGKDDAISLARDFILDPAAFAEKVDDVEMAEMLAELKLKVDFQLQVIVGKGIYVLSPTLYGFDDPGPVAKMRMLGKTSFAGEKEFRNKVLNIIISPHVDQGLRALLETGVTLPWVQATTVKRSDKQIIWKGQLRNATVVDVDDYWGGMKKYCMIYEEENTFVDNRVDDDD